MLRSIAAALGVVGCVSSALAQGHVEIWNYYVPPYNQVLWSPGVPVTTTDLILNFWIAPGDVSNESLLTLSGTPAFTIDPNITYNGGGYYAPQILATPTVGQYTVQLRASGSDVDEILARSSLYLVETVSTSFPAPDSGVSIGLTIIPEPTTFSLLSLGSLALFALRRKR